MNTAIQIFGSTGKVKPFPWGNSIYVNNTSDTIFIPYNPSMDFTGKSFTIAVWTNSPEPASTWNNLIANWNGVDNSTLYWSFMMQSSNLGINTRIMQGTTVQYQSNASGDSIAYYAYGLWDFRVYQVDLDGVNGVPGYIRYSDSRVNRNPTGIPFSFFNSFQLPQLALDYSFFNKVWGFNKTGGGAGGTRQKKYIDTVSFFDRALTESELWKLFNRGKGYLPTKIPNCVACYLFDESPGTAIQSSSETPGSPESRIILDHSGNGNHAYATGYGAGATDFVDHFTLI